MINPICPSGDESSSFPGTGAGDDALLPLRKPDAGVGTSVDRRAPARPVQHSPLGEVGAWIGADPLERR